MCATLSGHLPHRRHLTLLGVSVPVLFWWYIPAIKLVGANRHLCSQLKQSSTLSSDHHISTNFPCHFCPLIVSICILFIVFSITYQTLSFGISSLVSELTALDKGCLRSNCNPIALAFFSTSLAIERRPWLSL